METLLDNLEKLNFEAIETTENWFWTFEKHHEYWRNIT